MTDSNLLFIISQPRSGSTLLQKIISNTPSINTTSEPWLLLPFLSIFRTDLQKCEYGSGSAKQSIEEFLEKLDLNEAFVDEQRRFLLKLYKSLLTEETRYVLDKTPKYYEILDEIITYFPNAKIIILLRNPLHVLQSIIQTWNRNTLRGIEFYKRDLLLAPILLDKFYNEHRDNPNIYLVYYEDLINQSQEIGENLFRWLNLPFHNSILDYKLNQKAEGKMGDPIGVHLYNEIVTNENKVSKNDSYAFIWGTFISGYKRYLYNLELKSYIRYNINKGKKTSIFSYYAKTLEISWRYKSLTFYDIILYIKYRISLLS